MNLGRVLTAAQDIDLGTRQAITRVSNIIKILAAHFVPLTDTRLAEAYEWSIEHEEDAQNLFQQESAEQLVAVVNTIA